MNRHAQAVGENLQVLKGRSINSAFDKAEKVDRDVEQFGELLLAHLSSQANRFEAVSEFLAKGRQELHLRAECR